jgi:hypothetical protein
MGIKMTEKNREKLWCGWFCHTNVSSCLLSLSSNDPDLDSDSDSVSLILHFSSYPFHRSHLVFTPLVCIIHVH